ncbi:hypothetical protein FKM82_001999, partial [Ascaphus truei]
MLSPRSLGLCQTPQYTEKIAQTVCVYQDACIEVKILSHGSDMTHSLQRVWYMRQYFSMCMGFFFFIAEILKYW